MSNTSTIHIKTDFDCKVYDYGQELGTTKADTYFNIELRKGEHELTFVFTGDDSISKTMNYVVEDVDCDYRLDVKIAEAICDKAKEHFDSKYYSVAFALYSLAAEKGLAEAQYGLGGCYDSGIGVEKENTKAEEWYTKAAKQGHVWAQYYLGWDYYKRGEIVKAVEWWTKAAEQGNEYAQFNLGNCYYNGHDTLEKNLTKAVELWAKAAEKGMSDAQNNLGLCYYYGTGVVKDYSKAVELWSKAADNIFNSTAQCNLGTCYNNGTGVAKDLIKAFECYRKAAEQDNLRAQYYLGGCYENGIGVAKDLAKARVWYNKAAKQAEREQDCLYEHLSHEALERLKSIESKPCE